jgi:hypothetical protein
MTPQRFNQGKHMSSIANLTSASSALPSLNIRPHGHKKGSHVGSTDDSGSNTAGQVPVGTVQNLFGTLLQSLEQVIGVQLGATAPAATATAATAASAATATAATASSSAATASTRALAASYQADGSQLPAGFNVSVSA